MKKLKEMGGQEATGSRKFCPLRSEEGSFEFHQLTHTHDSLSLTVLPPASETFHTIISYASLDMCIYL